MPDDEAPGARPAPHPVPGSCLQPDPVSQLFPTDAYLGLDREQARALSDKEHRVLVDRTGSFTTRRADLVPARVNVRFDDTGRVVEADAG